MRTTEEITKVEYPIYECSLPEAKIAADLFSIKNDLQRVTSILTELLPVQENAILSDALFSAALITYRRCFNTGVRNGLIRKDIVALPNNAIELHDYLYNQANKLIAHSVNAFEQTKIGIVVSDNKNIVGWGPFSGRMVGFKEHDIRQWGSLVMLIGNTVLKPRLDTALEKVLVAAKTIPIEEIISSPVLKYKAAGPNDTGKRRP